MKHSRGMAALWVLAGIGAVVALVELPGLSTAQAPPPASPQPSQAGIPVTVATVVRQDVPVLLRNIGAVQPYQSVLVRSRVDGTLEQVFFEEGQDVKRGDKIAQIDARPYQALLEQAIAKKVQDEAQLANAKRDLARYTDLARNQYAAQQQVDTQAAQVRTLEAQIRADAAFIDAAQVNVGYTIITAPFDGRVGLRQIDVGNVVRAADTSGVGIVTINQIHPIAVTFSVPQDALPAIQAGMARGKLPAYAYASDDRTLLATGELVTPDNMIDSATGTIKLKARFPNEENRLWPGQFVNARVQVDVQKKVLTVPSIAVQRGPDGLLFVYAAKPDNTAAVVPVKMGQDDGRLAVITAGLEDGMQVVVNGQSRLQNGTRIAPTPVKPAS